MGSPASIVAILLREAPPPAAPGPGATRLLMAPPASVAVSPLTLVLPSLLLVGVAGRRRLLLRWWNQECWGPAACFFTQKGWQELVGKFGFCGGEGRGGVSSRRCRFVGRFTLLL